MFVAEINAIQDALPFYETHDLEARSQAIDYLARVGIDYDSHIAKLVADRTAIEVRAEQAKLNSEFLTSFRKLLPQPVDGIMVANNDDELINISKNVIWDNESPSYLIGRLSTETKKRFGKILLDHTVYHSTGPEGIGVLRIRNCDVDLFLTGKLLPDGIDEITASQHFNPITKQYNLGPRSPRSVYIGDPLAFRKNVIRHSDRISFRTMRQYTYGSKDESGMWRPAIPDRDMRDYNVMHFVARLAANFGVIDKLGDLLEQRKQTALPA